MEQKIPLYADAEGVAKLLKKPVGVSVSTFGEDLEKTGEIKAWLHPLSWDERNFVRGQSVVAYRFWLKHGGEPEDVRASISGVLSRLTIYFALRVGPEKSAKQLFSSQAECAEFPFEEVIQELWNRYMTEFSPSAEEWGNSLRARNLGTSSALPAISPALAPSEVKSPS